MKQIAIITFALALAGCVSPLYRRSVSQPGDIETHLVMGGLYGWQSCHGKTMARWLVPLYCSSPEMLAVAVYGKTGHSDWVAPLYYRDECWFATPLYAHRTADRTSDRQLFLPPLLTWIDWDMKGMAEFHSPLFGWTGGGTAQTNSWWATMLVGVRSGRREGGWLFPLVDFSYDPSFDDKADALRTDAMPARITFETETMIDSFGKSKTRTVKRGAVESAEDSTYLLLFDNDCRIDEMHLDKDGRYAITARRKIGNRLIFNYESRGEKLFDTATRWKLRDSGECGFVHWSLLWRLFRYERNPFGADKLDLLYLPVWR